MRSAVRDQQHNGSVDGNRIARVNGASPMPDCDRSHRAAEIARAAAAGSDALIRMMKAEAGERAAGGEPFDLRPYIDCAAALDDPAALDTAVDLAFSSLERDAGRSPDEARLELEIRYPDLARQIASTHAVRTMLRGGPSLEVAREFPRPFGPPDPHGPRYRLLRVIGAGAHGTVYEAIDEQARTAGAGGTVAVKIIEAAHKGTEWRLGDAVHSAAISGESSILAIRDVGETARGERYMTTELATAGSLQSALDRGADLAAEDAVRLVRDAALAADRAHKAGLVHGNIKPANIMLFGDAADTAGASVKIGDFGMPAGIGLRAAEYERGVERIDPSISGARLRALRDTLLFMAPECRGGQHRATVAADVYALAATLRHAMRFTHGECDARLARAVAVATAAAPQHRYATAAELASALSAWLEGRAIERVDTSPAQRLRLLVRRRPAAAIATAAAALAIASGAAGWVAHGRDAAYAAGSTEVRGSIHEMLAANAISFDRSSPLRDWLSATVLFDRMQDLGYFENLPTDRDSPELRAREIRTQLDDVERAGGTGTFEWSLLSLELALHQLRSSQPFDDTTALLDRAEARLAPAFGNDDPFAKRIVLMRQVLGIKRAVLEGSTDDPGVRSDYERLVGYLRSHSDGMSSPLDDSARRDPVALLVLRAVEHLSHASIYNDLDVRRWCEAQHVMPENHQVDGP